MQNRRDFLKLSSLTVAATSVAPKLTFAAPKKAPVILLRSSWNDHNIGDQGHTPGTLRLLERYVPEAEILLWHEEPRPETEKIITKNFPKVKIVRGSFYDGDKPFEGELKDAFDRANLYIVNSGMVYNYGLFGYDWPSAMSRLTPFYYCLERGVPFGLYGQSFDKFAHPSMPVFRDVFSRAAFIYTRDDESRKFLVENKFKPQVLEFGPDGCFGIDVRDEERGRAYLKKVGLEDQKFLAVVIRTNTKHIYDKGSGSVLNPAKPTPEQQEQDRQRLGKVRELITTWVRETGMKVLLAPEVSKEVAQAKTGVYDQLPADIQSKVVCRDTFWNADEAMSVYARAHSMFGIEPHSLIMGLALGVPVVHARALSHGKKGWMFRDIGVPEWLFDIDQASAKDLTAEVMKIHQNYPLAKEKARKAMAFVTDRQKAGMQVVRRNVNLTS
ncbi:polysaccharide pyruvyl transferase family protein [Fibrisoma montanum]|uniref:Polysaccharide pyruvyl transferase family protein n=1 Tax=Fibrisoma montanum TaxID=2305895 RepID=A0A418M5F8_9BACT|nr:polysaccharide pyruvyl transferase family protein [Fibrisoma montanum]RIV21189.1 polysaccharide pyruvyl transferase family protein [Fibrisoma montanum]